MKSLNSSLPPHQVEAMHSDCALVFQHMRARDDCMLILRQEKKKKNGSSRTGVLTAAARAQCELNVCAKLTPVEVIR